MGEAARDLAMTLSVAELKELFRQVVREESAIRGAEAQREILTREQVAELIQVSPQVVTRYHKNEGLPGQKIGNEWRFRRSEIMAWMESRGTRHGAHSEKHGAKIKTAKEG